MKISKILSLLLAVLMIAALFIGCAKKGESTDTQAKNQTEAPETTEAPIEGVYVEVNGNKIVIGVPFAEIKDKLPAETQPAETVDSCDPNSDWKQTFHYYGGFTVVENKDGIAVSIEVSEGECAVNGKIRIGSTRDEVKAALGTPDTDEAWGIYYSSSMPMMNFYLDEDTGVVTGFAIMTEFSV